ncbi:MAG: ParA family protein [Candidatus Omnitrophica bacterium]|nr:ParA family protein [Candidatus Omnitrophota bacterium]
MFEDLKAIFNKKNTQVPQPHIPEKFYSSPEKSKAKTVIISIVNQKGGCGKTTTSINLSSCLAKKGFKVLMIDLDAQAHASFGIGINVDNLIYSVYDILVSNLESERVIIPTYIKNLDIIPAVSLLTGAQLKIADLSEREGLLRTAIYRTLKTQIKSYDYIIIDCSPSLNLLTINGLVAAQSVLVPIQTHYFSLEGMKELFSTIELVRERLNSQLEILGILPTLFDSRAKMNKDILQQIKDYFKDKVFSTVIRRTIKLAEASLNKKSIFEYAPKSHGAEDYLALTEDVILLTRPDSINAQ